MIPKVIHYCWFGNSEKSELMINCINSWKKYCPDYEIREWNETNFDVNFCEYTKKAYKERKFAYLTDVARLKIIYENGGIYLDTDVELLDSLDNLLKFDAWFGYMNFENENVRYSEINTGSGFGAVKGDMFVEILLKKYLSFDNKKKFVVCNKIDTETFKDNWPNFVVHKEIIQTYENRIIINDIWKYTFHYCVNSWLPLYKKIYSKFRSVIKRILLH